MRIKRAFKLQTFAQLSLSLSLECVRTHTFAMSGQLDSALRETSGRRGSDGLQFLQLLRFRRRCTSQTGLLRITAFSMGPIVSPFGSAQVVVELDLLGKLNDQALNRLVILNRFACISPRPNRTLESTQIA